MRPSSVGDVIALAFVIGAITMMVRPGSRGPALVSSVASTFISSGYAAEGVVQPTPTPASIAPQIRSPF